MDFSPDPDEELIREAVRSVCARFDDAYWSERDATIRGPLVRTGHGLPIGGSDQAGSNVSRRVQSQAALTMSTAPNAMAVAHRAGLFFGVAWLWPA